MFACHQIFRRKGKKGEEKEETSSQSAEKNGKGSKRMCVRATQSTKGNQKQVIDHRPAAPDWAAAIRPKGEEEKEENK